MSKGVEVGTTGGAFVTIPVNKYLNLYLPIEHDSWVDKKNWDKICLIENAPYTFQEFPYL